jgi:oxalate decarboxylase/phosphoglucose isomerase-like protein (cupin superfamily)
LGALKATAEALREQSIILKGGKMLLSMNQPDGFDCPGCAWPDPKHTSSFEFCENGAKALAFEATSCRVTREFFAAHTVSELERKSDYWLEERGRLTDPMRYDAASNRYLPISWEDAFALIGRELRALNSPDAEFYTSGRTSNEAAFLYQLFVRRFGTNNFPDCSNMCHEPTSVGLPESIGIGKGTVILDDFTHADAIFVIGQNPALVTLRPGALREMHWHPNADEWQYYIKGKARIGVFNTGPNVLTMDFNAGDIGYVKRNYGHYAQNVGDTDMQFIAVFRASRYEEISLSDWLTHTPPALVAQHLNVDEAVINAWPSDTPVAVPE